MINNLGGLLYKENRYPRALTLLHDIKSQIVSLFKSLTYLTLHRKQQKSSFRCLHNYFFLTLWCHYLFLCSNDHQTPATTVKTVAWGKTRPPAPAILNRNWFCLVMIVFSVSHCSLSLQACQSQCSSPTCFLSPPIMHSFICSLLSGIFLPSCAKGSLHFWKDLHIWCTPEKSWKEKQEKVFQHFPMDDLCDRKW